MKRDALYYKWVVSCKVKSSPHYAYQFLTHHMFVTGLFAPVEELRRRYQMSVALHYAAISPVPADLGGELTTSYFRFEDFE
jgi:hypothetical protein